VIDSASKDKTHFDPAFVLELFFMPVPPTAALGTEASYNAHFPLLVDAAMRERRKAPTGGATTPAPEAASTGALSTGPSLRAVSTFFPDGGSPVVVPDSLRAGSGGSVLGSPLASPPPAANSGASIRGVPQSGGTAGRGQRRSAGRGCRWQPVPYQGATATATSDRLSTAAAGGGTQPCTHRPGIAPTTAFEGGQE